jgi:hypothetical protein
MSLKCRKCIHESKGHDQGFKEPIAGMYSCFPDIFLSYSDKAIGITDVNFGDVFHFGQLGQSFRDHWRRVLVLYGSLIEFPIVNAES